MKIDLPQRLDVNPVEADGATTAVSTKWQKEQTEAVRRSRSKSQPESPPTQPNIGIFGLLALSPSDFHAIGTPEGTHLLEACLLDVDHLLGDDEQTRQTINRILQDEIDRSNELQLRRGAER